VAFYGIMGQQFRRMIAKKTHASLKGKAKAGHNAGGRAYGFKVAKELHPTEQDEKGEAKVVRRWMEIEPEHARWVRQIFGWYREGMSTRAIAAELNRLNVLSPGSSWKRKVRRKDGKWLASTVYGILRNEAYIGRFTWNKSQWVKVPDSGQRKYVKRPSDEWITYEKPELAIVPRELWQAVRAREARLSRGGRGAAISKGIREAKKRNNGDAKDGRAPWKRGAARPSWLSSILTCGVCGARYQCDSRRDFICPSFAAGACENDLRVRRDKVDEAVWSGVKTDLLSDDQIRRGKAAALEWLREQAGHEEAAAREAESGTEWQRLDEQAAALHALQLPPAALSAALRALDDERAALRERATPRRGLKALRAEDLIDRVVATYRKKIQAGIQTLADPQVIVAARETVRRLLEDGKIVLSPTPDHTALTGVARFVELGPHLVEVVGGRRKPPHDSLVAGGRYELYSNYPLKIQAVAASVAPA
jgi:site-specific DNA recombinase